MSASYRGLAGIRRAFTAPGAVAMLFLGFGCGLPFLLLTSVTVNTWLREAGLSLSSIGLISFASFAYVLKPLWAPLLDRHSAPLLTGLGRRRSWILLSQGILAIALLAMASTDPAAATTSFVFLICIGALAGATQDTVVDAYRIEIAPLEAQAALAATYSLGYRIALYASGAGALYLAEFQSWHAAYLIMAALMLAPIAAVIFSKEPELQPDQIAERPALVDAFVRPFVEFFSRNGPLMALALLAFVGMFKFPDQVIGVLAGPFYLDSGYTKADIATVSKLYGVWIGLAGAFAGGVAVAAFGLRRMLLLGAVVVALSNVAYLLMAIYPAELWAFFAAITADNLSQGFAGTVLIAFMAGLTNRHFTATQYSLMVSLANLPGKFVGGLSGYLVEAIGYAGFFLFSATTVVPTLLLLAWLWPRIASSDRADGSASRPQAE